jgi:hypothetical protein
MDDPRFHQELLIDINADCAQWCPVEWAARTTAVTTATTTTADDGGADADDDGDAPANNWLAVATYELDEATQTRKGAAMVYTLLHERSGEGEEEQGDQRLASPRLALSARADGLPGVFDAQWVRLPLGAAAREEEGGGAEWGLSLALSDGRVVVLAVVVEEEQEKESGSTSAPRPQLRLEPAAEWQAIHGPQGGDATNRMALMVAWDRLVTNMTARAAVSGSGGTVAVLGSGGGSGNSESESPWTEWQAHDLEAWAVAFDPWRPPALYTGSDDASLKLWDLRMARRRSSGGGSGGSDGGGAAPAPASPPALLLCDKRTHAAGVTCISPHPSREFILATGSYDEKARLWDARKPRTPLAELDVGGGAWRLQWRPRVGGGADGSGDLLLAACMYNGFSVLRAGGLEDGDAASIEVVERYEAHESIAYGCDWWRGGGRRGGSAPCSSSSADDPRCIVATASFYDKRLHLWSPSLTQ